MFSKLVKNDTYAVEVFFSCLQEDDYVVKVDEAIYYVNFWFYLLFVYVLYEYYGYLLLVLKLST